MYMLLIHIMRKYNHIHIISFIIKLKRIFNIILFNVIFKMYILIYILDTNK